MISIILCNLSLLQGSYVIKGQLNGPEVCGEDMDKGTLIQGWWECKLVQVLWKTLWRFLKKLGIELPYDPEILLPHIYLKKKPKTLIQKEIGTPVFIAALFLTAKIRKQPKCPWTDEWIKKTCYILSKKYYSVIKKEWNIAICDNMNEPRGYYAKWNKSDRERQTAIIYMWNLKNKTSE